MRFGHTQWHHDNPTTPTEIYAEYDDAGWQLRKVEMFADGRITFADVNRSSGDTLLAEKALDFEEALVKFADPQAKLTLQEIDKATFEKIWQSTVN